MFQKSSNISNNYFLQKNCVMNSVREFEMLEIKDVLIVDSHEFQFK